MSRISFTIIGNPQSKANSRIIVRGKPGDRKGKIRSIKSKAAQEYVALFREQCPRMRVLMDDDVCVTMKIYYKSRRNDLDESLILDLMQNFIYNNDRQVKEKHIYWALDAERPRAEITVCTMDGGDRPGPG